MQNGREKKEKEDGVERVRKIKNKKETSKDKIQKNIRYSLIDRETGREREKERERERED